MATAFFKQKMKFAIVRSSSIGNQNAHKFELSVTKQRCGSPKNSASMLYRNCRDLRTTVRRPGFIAALKAGSTNGRSVGIYAAAVIPVACLTSGHATR